MEWYTAMEPLLEMYTPKEVFTWMIPKNDTRYLMGRKVQARGVFLCLRTLQY